MDGNTKWENGQNYPSLEIIINLSDLFGLTIDELLRSDEELTKKVIRDSKQLAYPKLKYTFDVLFLAGVVLLLTKLGVLVLNKFTPMDIPLFGGNVMEYWTFIADGRCGNRFQYPQREI